MLRLTLAVCTILTFVSFATAASGDVGAPEPTVEAVADKGTWEVYTPLPVTPGIVCMVDSGVDPNPDTSSSVIGGQALSADTSTLDEVATLSPRAQPGNHPDGHGTLMAMTMAAPRNEWGMVGLAPTSVRVYNMKALSAGQLLFPAKEFYQAIEVCQRLHESTYPGMTVVNLSLGGEASPEGSALNGFKRAVASAREAGMSIVASAGDTGGSVQFPADYGPVLAVGAADAAQSPGALCWFASRGEGLDVLAPGCDTLTGGLEGAFEDTGEIAFGSGASQAASEVAAVEASIDSYDPSLTPEETEACITSSADHGELDAEAAFDACGLERIVQAGKQAEQASHEQSSSGPATTTGSSTPCGSGPCQPRAGATREGTKLGLFEARCSTPRLRVMRSGRRVRLQPRRTPSACRIQARVGTIVHGAMRWKRTYTGKGAVLSVLASAHETIQARFRGLANEKLSSAWVPVTPTHR
jgi:hypothetical protein